MFERGEEVRDGLEELAGRELAVLTACPLAAQLVLCVAGAGVFGLGMLLLAASAGLVAGCAAMAAGGGLLVWTVGV